MITPRMRAPGATTVRQPSPRPTVGEVPTPDQIAALREVTRPYLTATDLLAVSRAHVAGTVTCELRHANGASRCVTQTVDQVLEAGDTWPADVAVALLPNCNLRRGV